jgi:DNA-binding XRE family transcriptional regulator
MRNKAMGVQIVELGNEKHALIPIAEYNQLIAELEDRDDVRFAAEAEVRRVGGEEYLPLEMVDRLLAGESALRVWRKHRGLKQLQLAAISGVGNGQISNIEQGGRGASLETWQRLAQALRVDLDDIVPEIDT